MRDILDIDIINVDNNFTRHISTGANSDGARIRCAGGVAGRVGRPAMLWRCAFGCVCSGRMFGSGVGNMFREACFGSMSEVCFGSYVSVSQFRKGLGCVSSKDSIWITLIICSTQEGPTGLSSERPCWGEDVGRTPHPAGVRSPPSGGGRSPPLSPYALCGLCLSLISVPNIHKSV